MWNDLMNSLLPKIALKIHFSISTMNMLQVITVLFADKFFSVLAKVKNQLRLIFVSFRSCKNSF